MSEYINISPRDLKWVEYNGTNETLPNIGESIIIFWEKGYIECEYDGTYFVVYNGHKILPKIGMCWALTTKDAEPIRWFAPYWLDWQDYDGTPATTPEYDRPILVHYRNEYTLGVYKKFTWGDGFALNNEVVLEELKFKHGLISWAYAARKEPV
jgi:hypothetical protein